MSYENKYLKYKYKYQLLKKQIGGMTKVKSIEKSNIDPLKYNVLLEDDETFDLTELLAPNIPTNDLDNTITCCSMFFDVDKKTLKKKLVDLCLHEENNEICNDPRLYKYYKDNSDINITDSCPIVMKPEWEMLLNIYTRLLKFIYSIRYYLKSIRKTTNLLDCYMIPCISLIDIEQYNIQLDEMECIKFPDPSYVKPGFPTTLKEYLNIMISLNTSSEIKDSDITVWIKNTLIKEEFKKFEEYLSDYQPWTNNFIQFLKYYTIENIPMSHDFRNYIDFITPTIYEKNIEFYKKELGETEILYQPDMNKIIEFILTI
jgi:hypothetical protein